MLVKNLFLILALSVTGTSCSMMENPKEIHGKYSVYCPDESNRPAAKKLAAYVDSVKASFTELRLSGSQAEHHYRLDIEGRFDRSLPQEQQDLLASRLARRFSRDVFAGDTCTIFMQPSLSPKARFHTRGTSADPKLDQDA